MDPISATLAVITFATAVKDIIELGQKIHESFTKVSSNFRNAQRVAVDIKEMLDEIRVFCDEHSDQLDNMKDFKSAVCDLVQKLRTFEAAVLPLLPIDDKPTSSRFIRGWNLWRKSSKIEASIMELQRNIVKVMRRHMMKSTMRAEVKLETIHQATSTGFADMKKDVAEGIQVLDNVRRDVYALRTATARYHTAAGPTDIEFERNVVALADSSPSTSMPVLRSPTVITEEILTNAFIKFQIHGISSTLDAVSQKNLLRMASDQPLLHFKFDFSDISMPEATMGRLNLGRHIVRQITAMRDLLDAKLTHSISLVSGLHGLSRLSLGLNRLAMKPEALLINNLSINLARILVATCPQPDCTAALAVLLKNQSSYYGTLENFEALQAIVEADIISRGLQSTHPTQPHFVVLRAQVLIQYAHLLKDQRSVGMLIEAVRLLDTLLGIQTFTKDEASNEITTVIDGNTDFLRRLFSDGPFWSTLNTYAAATQRLGGFLWRNGQDSVGVKFEFLAISVYRKLVQEFSTDDRYTKDLASALSSLVRPFTKGVPTETLVDIAEESAQIYRDLAYKNPVSYARQLADVLWDKALCLEILERNTEAISTWKEVATLSETLIQDAALCASALDQLSNQLRKLDMHEEAAHALTLAITTYDQDYARASRHLSLGREYKALHRYQQAIQSFQTSVGLYRRLALNDAKAWVKDLSLAFADLAFCFASMGDDKRSAIAWKDSVRALEEHIHISQGTSDSYFDVLPTLSGVSYLLDDMEDCYNLCCTVTRNLRSLSEISPESTGILDIIFLAEMIHGHNLLRFGYPAESERHVNDMLLHLESESHFVSPSQHACRLSEVLNMKAQALDAQGLTEDAILDLRRAQTTVKPFCPLDELSFACLIESATHEAHLLASLDRYDDAHKVASEALRLSRETQLERKIEHLAWSLYTAAYTALAAGRYDLAEELAQEGCCLCATPEMLQLCRESWELKQTVCARIGLMGLLSSAYLNLGRTQEALDFAQRAVDTSLEVRTSCPNGISASTSRQCYMETAGYLVTALLVSGRLSEARDILEKRKDYFAKRVDRVLGDNRELVPILLALSLLYCHEGRHEEGHAAGLELQTLLASLGYAFASLEQQAKARLRQIYKGPPGRVLRDLEEGLMCGGHTNTCSLFDI